MRDAGLFATEIGRRRRRAARLAGRFWRVSGICARRRLLLSRKDGALLAYAKTITYWHGRNHFCGSCGSPSRVGEGGHLRVCSNPECGALHFPRTDPAIIVLIWSGEKCLLGRQPIWPKLMHSVIAGFVEPGESAEWRGCSRGLRRSGRAG